MSSSRPHRTSKDTEPVPPSFSSRLFAKGRSSMAFDRLPPDDPREWLNRARSDLALATAEQVVVYFEDLCFHAQQAVEKSLKALLLALRIRFPYVHDLG